MEELTEVVLVLVDRSVVQSRATLLVDNVDVEASVNQRAGNSRRFRTRNASETGIPIRSENLKRIRMR